MRNTETTLVEVSLPRSEGTRPVFRLLFEGRTGPTDVPAREIRSRPLVIGRDNDAEGLQIDDPRVSRHHLKLWSRSGGLEVLFEDSSTNGTFVNGQRLSGGRLEDGDILRLGDSFLLIRSLPDDEGDAPDVASLVGSSPEAARLRREVSRAGPTDATVLISGESGTGKELVARELHARSNRTGPSIVVNCGAIPQSLAESQLFGHVAGSFTGAREHLGFFRSAHQGTLFLDEIGELPLEVQPKLLRVLEDHQVIPVGGVAPFSVDVRIVVATNRDLEDALDTGRFRGDLYARLAEIMIHTPPLRERREDILPLFRLGFGAPPPLLSPDLVEAMLLHRWPYNVRELFKIAKELLIVSEGRRPLDLDFVRHRFTRQRPATDQEPAQPSKKSSNDSDTREITKRYETDEARKLIPSREQIEQLLGETEGNISELARRLGRSRRQIHRYLQMYDITVTPFKSSNG